MDDLNDLSHAVEARTLRSLDLVDLGLVRHFLGSGQVTDSDDELWRESIVAASSGCDHIAFAHSSRAILLRQLTTDSTMPALLDIPDSDTIRCIIWLETDRGAAEAVLAG